MPIHSHIRAKTRNPLASQLQASLWLDAANSSNLTLNGNLVTQWIDKSGNNRNAYQNTAGNQPTYDGTAVNGMPGIKGNGTSSMMVIDNNPMHGAANFAIFAVATRSVTDTGWSDILVNRQPGNGDGSYVAGIEFGMESNFQHYGLNANSSVFFNGTVSWRNSIRSTQANSFLNDGIARQCSIQWVNNSNPEMYIDGTNQTLTSWSIGVTTNNVWPPINNGIGVFASPFPYSAGGYLDGYICEIIVTNRSINSDERQKIEGYLANKWGITNSLPASHPYKLNPPTW